ncbi:MAG: MerR family transcriptional regulator [Spirochaetaceae bacterium]
MTRFLIGQVCTALGVKPHVLRYWERNVALLSPAKDRSGRRVYTLRDVQLLFRLKYLIQTRRMSVEGASRKLMEEAQGGGQNRKAAIDALRGELLRSSVAGRRLGIRLDGTGESVFPSSSPIAETRPVLSALAPRLSVGTRYALGRQIRHLGTEPARTAWHLLREVLTEGSTGSGGNTEGASVRPFRRRRGQHVDVEEVRARLREEPLLVMSPAPAPSTDDAGTYPGLMPLRGCGGETVIDRIGRSLAGAVERFSQVPVWRIGAAPAAVQMLREHLARRRHYGLSAERVQVYEEPAFPRTDPAGRLLVDPQGEMRTYRLPLFTAIAQVALPAPVAADGKQGESVRRLPALIVPPVNADPRVPDEEFIAHHLVAGAAASIKTFGRHVGTQRGAPHTSGEMLIDRDRAQAFLRGAVVVRNRMRIMATEENDDILEVEAISGRFNAAAVLRTAGGGLVFEAEAAVSGSE